MSNKTTNRNSEVMTAFSQKIERVKNRIAPAWPLKNFVAVNPYMGYAEESFVETAKQLKHTGGFEMLMPFAFYLDQLEAGKLEMDDIASALKKHGITEYNQQDLVKELKLKALETKQSLGSSVVTLADSAEKLSKIAWNEFILNRVSDWASSYFDDFQASLRMTSNDEEIYLAWRKFALVDRSPRIAGLKNFHTTLQEIPEDSEEALIYVLEALDIPESHVENYLLRLHYNCFGWSSYIAGVDWDNRLYAGNVEQLKGFLTILLSWELGILRAFESQGIHDQWKSALQISAETSTRNGNDRAIELRAILQDASDFAAQRELISKLARRKTPELPIRPEMQAVFCIDVRSEVYRRNLESINERIETVGFAGFFGLPIQYLQAGHEVGKNQCPVLIPSGFTVKESRKNAADLERLTAKRCTDDQVNKVAKVFRSGPVSSFGFVSPLGLFYLPKLIGDSFGWTKPNSGIRKALKDEKSAHQTAVDLSAIAFDDQVNLALSSITAMGFQNRFAPVVMITGHGATTINNPHASGLDCGACGGHSGEINALTSATLLNDPSIREALVAKGITIPEYTFFLACLHNTTTDVISMLNASAAPESHKEALVRVEAQLKEATFLANIERGARMNIGFEQTQKEILKRSNDWAQVRPEWGLAGCNAFVVAQRAHTRGVNLAGKSFLHDYDYRADDAFKILESIMTAPMVVTSWINLQYYASTVDNLHFGSGNKLLHNVTSGVGVIEGAAGDLRIGLPWQSVHDGTQLQHIPQRLNVVIQAPIEAIEAILSKHSGIRNLVDNEWIKLLKMNNEGRVTHRYTGGLTWSELDIVSTTLKEKKQEFLVTV